jgi:transcriptional regulator with XRE-family HTH domain
MHKSLYSRPNDVVLALLRDERLARRLRQSDLAFRLGRSQALVSRVESGERRLDIAELVAWLSALDTDIVSFAQELHDRLEGQVASHRRRGKRLRCAATVDR